MYQEIRVVIGSELPYEPVCRSQFPKRAESLTSMFLSEHLLIYSLSLPDASEVALLPDFRKANIIVLCIIINFIPFNLSYAFKIQASFSLNPSVHPSVRLTLFFLQVRIRPNAFSIHLVLFALVFIFFFQGILIIKVTNN